MSSFFLISLRRRRTSALLSLVTSALTGLIFIQGPLFAQGAARPTTVVPTVTAPTPGGGGGGGNAATIIPGIVGGGGGGGGNAIANLPGILAGGGGGGAGAVSQPTISAPRGGLAGETITARILLPTQTGGQNTTASTTYQWSVSGGRIISDARVATLQFIADIAGTVTLNVAIAADGTSYNATAQVTIVSAQTAGAVTSPATIATNAAAFTASVPGAQNGDRTFRWTVTGGSQITAGQGTATVTLSPGAAGLRELTCNVNLQNLVTVPVRAYVVVTGAGAPTVLTINGGSGGATVPAGTRVDIFAHAPAAGQVFDRWTGDVAALGTGALAPLLAHTVLTMPATAVTLTATYKSAPTWAAVVVPNFNPQTQTAANGQTTTLSATLSYFIPANAVGIVMMLHDTGGSQTDWFSRPEQVLLARELVATGFGVAALSSVNRTTGNWGAQSVLSSNLDALNHTAALDRFGRDGLLANTKPIFFIGTGAGANAALRFGDLLSNAPAERPVKGAILYLTTGVDTLAVTSKVPQFFALATNDDNLGPTGLSDAQNNSQLLGGRGIATGIYNNPVSPVLAGRFRALSLTNPTFTAADAQAIWSALKTAGFIDENNYVKAVPTAAALTAALPATYQNRSSEVSALLAVSGAEREFFSDANARVLAFMGQRVTNAPTPTPGRLVNLSTRTKIAHLNDAFALGFNISGTQPAQLLIRGIGPALTKFGLAGALPALRLEVNRGATVIAMNEGWDKAAPAGSATAAQIATAAASVGAFALGAGDLDTAVLLQLTPGTYTANIKGINGAIGDVLAEIYDVSRNGTRLTNLSTLASISAEGDFITPGLVIAGTNPRTLVVRAVAQGLSEFGIPSQDLIGDARISILTTAPNGNVQTVGNNNNWGQTNAAVLTAAFPAVGAFPLKTASDAAIVDSLAPGNYTLQAGGAPTIVFPAGVQIPANFVAPNQTGRILVEVYEVP